MTYEFVIPGRLPGLNDIIEACRKGKYVAARQKQDAENIIMFYARSLPKLKEPVRLDYLWLEKARTRDWDNISGGQKFVQDALVKAHKIKNDGWSNICHVERSYGVDKDNPRIIVTITDSEVED